MRRHHSVLFDFRLQRFKVANCDFGMAFKKSVITLCVCFGIIMCGMFIWQAEAFNGPDKRTVHLKSQHSNYGQWSFAGDSPGETSSTTVIRQRSIDHVPYESLSDDSWSTTGDTWSSSDHISPTFDESTPKNITTQLGQTAYLHCIVNNLGDKTVSWIRRKDFHVLTVGLDIYTSDDRFQPIHIHNTEDWALQIKFTQLKDEGTYECQVGSDPKISFFVGLTVLVAKAAIEGAPDIYVKSGSSINLTCVITQSPSPPLFVFWYHDDRMINYDNSRGQIAVLQKGTTPDTAISKLAIVNVQPSDSGNYTCCPSNAEATSITVHVLNGEKPAAMQHDANPGLSLSCPLHHHSNSTFHSLCALLSLLLMWFFMR